VKKILREGNEAQRWLKQLAQGIDSQTVLMQAIEQMHEQELALQGELCQPAIV
jgi:gamma-glutamyl:cysteine ligase YbdK (ATP-grasp superfamily)